MNSATRMTVLCVEDEDSQLELRKMLFEGAGFDFLGARSGAQGLELLRSSEIHAVVLDYWMSGMNGMELAEKMKRERPAVPIIMLSGFPSLPGEGVGLVDAWFQKARVEPDVLIDRIKQLIGRKPADTVE